MATQVEVHGLKGLTREIKAIDKALVKDVKAISKDAAEIVAVEARVIVPRLTGRLGASIKAGATVKGAYVKAKTPYSGVIHWGFPRRHIKATPFLYTALDSRVGEVIDLYESRVADLIDDTFKDGVHE